MDEDLQSVYKSSRYFRDEFEGSKTKESNNQDLEEIEKEERDSPDTQNPRMGQAIKKLIKKGEKEEKLELEIEK